MTTAVVVFTRDLRVRDNPVLSAAAATAEWVVPLFVADERIVRMGFAGPGRSRFLAESLADLDRSLRGLGARLVLRGGEVVEQVCRVAAEVNAERVHIATDVSAYACAREAMLRSALAGQRRELRCHDEVHTVLAPARITPQGKDHFAIFTPYYRQWCEADWRQPVAAPESIRLPEWLRVPEIEPGTPPEVSGNAPRSFEGGETAGRRRADRWLAEGVRRYDRQQDGLAADGTSRLSPYLHLGCVSARELAERAGHSPAAGAFVRQLAWRDFHHQVLAARPDTASHDYRHRGDRWRDDPEALAAWQEGRTGVPIVDAGMRQLRVEGWMHNRARLITGSFLTKTLYLDWRAGAAHFFEWLVDGDLANNCLNWQWVAGTGTDTRPNRVLNPLRQARRYDPAGDYVRRYLPELADLNDATIHQPWKLPGPERHRLDYPPPIVDLDAARDRFRASRPR